MLQIETRSDPIVEILRLAYRRGLALRQEQEEKSRAMNPSPLQGAITVVELAPTREIEEAQPTPPAASHNG
jgi:hypothetical protein